MNDILKITLGAVLALSSGIVTQVFVARQNELTQRIDELVKLIWDYAELSSKYWAGDFTVGEIGKIEARMVAMDHFIGSMLAEMFATNVHFQMKEEIERTLLRLSNSTTGGSFQVKNRANDSFRSSEVYTNASELCVRLRSERRKLIKLSWFPWL
jgi:hypothetical protein